MIFFINAFVKQLFKLVRKQFQMASQYFLIIEMRLKTNISQTLCILCPHTFPATIELANA